MDRKEMSDLAEIPFPDLGIITKETIRAGVEASQRGYRVDVRVAMGKVYTSEEYEARRRTVLAMRLPCKPSLIEKMINVLKLYYNN